MMMKDPAKIRAALMEEGKRISDAGKETVGEALLDLARTASTSELLRFAEIIASSEPEALKTDAEVAEDDSYAVQQAEDYIEEANNFRPLDI